jgi:hypothetical protein
MKDASKRKLLAGTAVLLTVSVLVVAWLPPRKRQPDFESVLFLIAIAACPLWVASILVWDDYWLNYDSRKWRVAKPLSWF